MTTPYPKGAEWRKWDLHVHTPLSIFQKFGTDDEDTATAAQLNIQEIFIEKDYWVTCALPFTPFHHEIHRDKTDK